MNKLNATLRFKSLETLDQKAQLRYIKPKKLQDLIINMENLYDRIQHLSKSNNKDIEVEYIYLSRYFTMLKMAQESPDFKKKSYPMEFIKAKELYNRLADVTDQLKKWYSNNGAKTLENSTPNVTKTQTADLNKNNRVGNAVIEREKDVQNGNAVSNERREEKEFIEPSEFYTLVKNNAVKPILILDVRSTDDFKSSQIIPPVQIINIPPELLKAGLSAAKLRDKLKQHDRLVWDKRSEIERIIILDWKSTSTKQQNELKLMRDIILKWDPSTSYKCKPVFVNGGYEEILSMYPMITTRPKVNPPRNPSPELFSSLHSLNYPDIDMSIEQNKRVKQMEAKSFDRLLKPKVHSELSLNNSVITPAASQVQSPTISEDKSNDSDSNVTIPDSSSEEGEPIPVQDIEESTSKEQFDLSEMRKKKPAFQPSKTQINSSSDLIFSKSRNGSSQDMFSKTSTPSLDHSKDADSDSETNYITLKENGTSSVTPSFNSRRLHKTSSSPNISKLNDNELIIPTFSRSNKPVSKFPAYGERADSTYGSSTAEGLTGLKNFANNCYMNSIIQCLSNTQPLVEALIGTTKDSLEVVCNPRSRTKGKIATEVKQAFNHMWRGGIRVYSISDLKEEMGNVKDIFKGSAHQDSNEFLIILLEHLHEDLKMPSVPGSLAGAKEETGEKAWGEFKQKNSSIIQRLFYGQHKSTVSCATCDYTSVTFEQFFNLFVPLPPRPGTVSLMECIQLYMSGERISGWKCPKCKTERNATKKFDISILPRILVIALKRFTQDDDSWLHKKENIVSYPLTNMDMSRFVVPGSEQRFYKYDLYAMSIHSGTLKSGHYRAICKNHHTNRWYMFDDQSIEPLPEVAVENNPEVYILFYKAVKED
ncbi:ubiquitin carboxyl-terminal hydrolase 8-like [Cimex lectularius]|uniref:Ubiquitin carboxyl-terminal hydrolase n=1 Tax=Cimex lectularius TaxID=79782 RepID=A0A8I6S1Q3_CIMLE|nr:ubiquitin carboxyl-terminal hydrolase 8-like [Cimex lectularius]